jgi:hypothetical protein
MRNPDLFTAAELKKFMSEVSLGNGAPARPHPFIGLRWFRSIRIAFGVLTGKYDAVDWEDRPYPVEWNY